MAIVVPSGGSKQYNGESLNVVIEQSFDQNVLFNAGRVYVQGGVKHKKHVHRADSNFLLQPRVATPVSSQGNLTFSDITLIPDEYMLYTEFNPHDLDEYWTEFQTSGPLVWAELPPSVQAIMIGQIMAGQAEQHGNTDLQGDKTSLVNPTKLYDGWLTKMKAGNGRYADAKIVHLSGSISNGAGTAGGAAQVLAAFDQTNAGIFLTGNEELRKAYSSPNFFYTCSPLTAKYYRDAVRNQTYKGNDFTAAGPMTFDGKPIIENANMPNDAIFATVGTTGRDSNLWIGVDDSADATTLQIDKVSNASELYFAKMIMKRVAEVIDPRKAILTYFEA